MTLIRALVGAAAIAAAAAAPLPAAAQTITQICVMNSTGILVVRSRFHYTDWRGQRHTSGWVSSTHGFENCVRLQDVTNVEAETEALVVFVWDSVCRRAVPAQGGRQRVIVTTVGVNTVCAAQ